MPKYDSKYVKSYVKANVKKYARHMTKDMQNMINSIDIAMSNTNMTKYMTYMQNHM